MVARTRLFLLIKVEVGAEAVGKRAQGLVAWEIGRYAELISLQINLFFESQDLLLVAVRVEGLEKGLSRLWLLHGEGGRERFVSS